MEPDLGLGQLFKMDSSSAGKQSCRMLQNFMICLEIKTLILDIWLSTSGMILPFLLNSCCCFLRLSLVITFCRKVRVTLLFSDSSLFCHGCYPIELQFSLYMIILSCQTVSY